MDISHKLSRRFHAATGTPCPSRIRSSPSQSLTKEGQAALQAYVNNAALPDMLRPEFPRYRVELLEFYGSLGNTLPWLRDTKPTSQARALTRLFEDAEDEGLNPEDYDGPRWEKRVAALDHAHSETDLIRFDLALTVSVMRYVSDLHLGRVNPRLFHFDLNIENKKIDLSEFLRQKLVNAGTQVP